MLFLGKVLVGHMQWPGKFGVLVSFLCQCECLDSAVNNLVKSSSMKSFLFVLFCV